MDTSKPFIGYKSAGRRPERNNDREGAKGAPLAAIRGWIAGTAGLPGDLEGLVRMLPGVERKEPVLPTSDFYKEWLPLRGDSPTERAFTELGSLTGGAGVGSTVRAAKTGVSAGARGALSAIEAAARNAAVPRTLSPQAGVIKMKGGNWLSGSVEEALKGLRNNRVEDQTYLRAMREPGVRESYGAWLEQKISENPAYQRIPGIQAFNQFSKESGFPALTVEGPEASLNDWVDKKLARYIKNEMATPEDPVRALAERGVLHVNPEQLNFRPEMHGRYLREGQTAVAENPAAKVWEGASDLSLTGDRAEDILNNYGGMGPLRKSRSGEELLSRNPWLEKVSPDTKVYASSEPAGFADDLGFNHLVDELRNATSPESGLPRELLWKYADLDKVTVPQAVERVAKINEWRAAQKVLADQVRANNAATVLHKEYPEGYRWVELKAGDLPEGWRAEKDALGVDRLRGPDGQDTLPGNLDDPRYSALRDALKYEGDTMGHCVGGYCDDVAAGRSRIFSLRDKKGQPHTTIETAPTGGGVLSGEIIEDLAPGSWREYLAQRNGGIDSLHEWFRQTYPDLANAQRIVQIKGKQNKAPNPEYLPYVQDFVRSGQWSDVGDISNSGLIDLQNMRDVPEYLKSGSRFLTQSEYDDAVREFVKQRDGGNAPGFSRGGAVNANDYDPNRVDAIVQALEAELQ